ncbi:MAG: preQ(1) synthase [Deltaproteobacteria bacterium]|nr:preQ(1) synthase [Deltaproteobacteria bacterium]
MERPDAPHADLLESFSNRYPERPYIIRLTFPEFTSLCPVTGQPDFGTIVTDYIPDRLCVESKSYKLYLFAFRDHRSFMETITNTILDDLVTSVDPLWCRVKGLFAPRGATRIQVFAEYCKQPAPDRLRDLVRDWKTETAPAFSE